MLVVSLPSSLGLGEAVAKGLRSEHREVTHKVFPDGESYLRLNFSANGEEVLLIQTTYPDQEKRLLEIVAVAETLKRKGASRVVALIPYLAYARQDREFLPGEVVTADVVLSMLRKAGLEGIYVVDVHKEEVLRRSGMEYGNFILTKTFAEHLRRQGIRNALIVSPDVGAIDRAKALAEELRMNYLVFRKFRDRNTGKVMHELPTDIEVPEEVVLIDDIISTGGTMANLVKYLRSKGVRKVHVLASHGIFVGGAEGRLFEAGATDIAVLRTVGKAVEGVKYLDIAPEVIERLKEALRLGPRL